MINVTFNDARAISPLEVYDLLVVNIKNLTWPLDPMNEIIFAEDIGKTIDDFYRVLKKPI